MGKPVPLFLRCQKSSLLLTDDARKHRVIVSEQLQNNSRQKNSWSDIGKLRVSR